MTQTLPNSHTSPRRSGCRRRQQNRILVNGPTSSALLKENMRHSLGRRLIVHLVDTVLSITRILDKRQPTEVSFDQRQGQECSESLRGEEDDLRRFTQLLIIDVGINVRTTIFSIGLLELWKDGLHKV
jgi:hypothetical protein